MSVKRLMSLAVAVLSTVAGAETYTWTGAQNGFWTNAANWTVGGEVATKCPGVCSNEIFAADGSVTDDWTTRVALADLAEFTTVADGAQKTLDLSGLYCISSIVFRAGCPVYTLGTADDGSQIIALESFGTSAADTGRFEIEANASVPTLIAGFSIGMTYKPLRRHNDIAYIAIYNNSAQTLKFNKFGYSQNPVLKGQGFAHCHVEFYGSGPLEFGGAMEGIRQYSSLYQCAELYFHQSGKVTFSAPLFGRGIDWEANKQDDVSHHGLLYFYVYSNCTQIEIKEGCRVAFSEWNAPTLHIESNVRIFGGGTLQLCCQSNKGISGNWGNVDVSSGYTAQIDTPIDLYDSSNPKSRAKTALRFSSASSAGTLAITGPTNMITGPVWFWDSPVNYRANKVANFGVGDSAYFLVNGAFDYAGHGGETFDRTCVVTNAKKAVVATVRNTGDGLLTVASEFRSDYGTKAGSSVVLDPQSAPILFTGKFSSADGAKLPLVKTGADTLVLSPEADFTDAQAIVLRAGSLDVSQLVQGNVATLPVALSFDTGVSVVPVPEGVTLLVPSLALTAGATAGTVNFLCGSGRVKVPGKSSGDPMPTGVLVNGTPAVFTDDGTLNVTPPAYDTAIGAKGDVVPHAADDVVAIMSEGTSGDDTLASDATAVKELVHFVGADATVAIGAERSLTAEAIRVYPLAGNLSVGAAEDAGTVSGGGTGGRLLLENRNPVHALTVNAKVASGTDVCVEGGAGTVTLTGGLANGAAVKMTDGTLVLSGAGEYDLRDGQSEIGTASTEALDARLVVDGGAKVTLGENPLFVGSWRNRVTNQKSVARLVVTNATICNVEQTLTSVAESSTNASICVGYRSEAVMEVHAGAVISNRLVVGGVYGSKINGNTKHGAVYQDGGSVTAFGSNSAHGLVIGSEQNANGYYELKGGDFTVLGILAVGYYGRGSFVQFGGTSHFAKPSHSPSWTTVDVGPISQGNGGNATMRFAGGKAKVDDDVRLVLTGGATNRGRSRLTVEEEAELDCGTGAIKLGAVHSNNNYGNTAFFAIRGGAVRAAGFFGGYNSSNPTCPLLNSVGFDGGTLVTSVNGSDIFMGTTSSAQLVTNVIVYAGGMTVDTDGKTGCGTVVPIRGAWGKGVSQISFVAKSGLVAAPVVDIDGDGVGAVAVAEFDSTTGTMTGIKVVNPGAGYTRATVTAWTEGGTAFSDTWGRELSLADNQNTGSFTKKGEGDFTLGAANTWGGATILKGGVLRLGVTGALPEATTVVYDGGTLAVADGVELPATLNIEVPNLTEGKKVPLLTFEGTVPATLPTVRCEGLDTNEWKFALYGKTLKLAPVRGMTLLVR